MEWCEDHGRRRREGAIAIESAHDGNELYKKLAFFEVRMKYEATLPPVAQPMQY